MSYDEYDAMLEEGMNSLYEELGPQWATDHAQELYEENYSVAVEEFTNERLRSFYEKNPLVALRAVNALNYATELLPTYNKAALVFAASAIELTWKEVLLRPMLYGLVHAETLAPLIVKLSTRQQGFERFEKLLMEILKHVSNKDFSVFTRDGSLKTLVREINYVSECRNKVLHAGYEPSISDAQLALDVATTLLSIYSDVVTALHVKMTNGSVMLIGRSETR